MDTSLEITIYDEGKLAYRTTLATAAEVGRQNIDEQPPYGEHPHSGMTRVVIARLDEVTIPRKLLRLERAGERVRLTNLSRLPLRLDVGAPLDPGGARDLVTPFTVMVGGKSLFVRAAAPEPEELESLSESSLTPASDPAASLLIATVAKDRFHADGQLDNETLVRWIQAVLGVLQSAAGTNDFFRRAARALVDLVGLDFGCVLLPDHGRWAPYEESIASHLGPSGSGRYNDEWQPSRQVLDSVRKQKKTFWQKEANAQATESLVGVKSVVASPILSATGDVIGVLYGERRRSAPVGATAGRLLAMLVEMLAGGVAAGLARLEQEKTRTLWEQFVTPDLSRQLAENPRLLEGRDADVTMLSCDIRGFSRICNNLGPARTLDWVQDALGTLSDCVLAEDGVLVDYVGDELLAMWGAPKSQPDHAARACRAALAMLASVPVLNTRWLETVREKMGLGIGISSGTARVGNIGSARKFKYGALGTTVNLASRVQGATRYLKVPVLLTGAVRERIGDDLRTRRLCQIEVVNIPEPVTVYQLAGPDFENWDSLKEGYEQALTQFERREFRAAARGLGVLLGPQSPHRDDGPSLVLIQRSVGYFVEEPKDFNPVWKLPDKGK